MKVLIIRHILIDTESMKPPSPDRIKWEQHAESWNISEDFHNVMPQCKNYDDEASLI